MARADGAGMPIILKGVAESRRILLRRPRCDRHRAADGPGRVGVPQDQKGREPGPLSNPDGVHPAPPCSLLMQHSKTGALAEPPNCHTISVSHDDAATAVVAALTPRPAPTAWSTTRRFAASSTWDPCPGARARAATPTRRMFAMPQIARLSVLATLLALSLAGLLRVPPAAANDQTCDHLISAPGLSTAGITISTGGTYCLATDVIMRPASRRGMRSRSPRTSSRSI